jgi:hypothetical protein
MVAYANITVQHIAPMLDVIWTVAIVTNVLQAGTVYYAIMIVPYVEIHNVTFVCAQMDV